MSFNTALSGIRAANTDLQVTGNNIANASTIGFKSSRAEFGDVYSSTLLGGGSNTAGSGVTLQNIRQQFTQGNLKFTQNELDLSVNGEGFFVVEKNGERLYTRAGTFGLDKDGYIVNGTNAMLQGFAADDDGNVAIHVRDGAESGTDLGERFVVFRDGVDKDGEQLNPVRSSVGLALTRSLLAVNACTLSVDPTAGTGTLFSLLIPAELVVKG